MRSDAAAALFLIGLFAAQASGAPSTLVINGKSAPYAFAYGETLSCTFYNNKTASNGAIAIFPVTDPPSYTSHTFVRTCGDPFCTTPTESGTVVFSSALRGVVWPIAAGNWYVVLIDSAGYQQTKPVYFTVGPVASRSPPRASPATSPVMAPPVVMSPPPTPAIVYSPPPAGSPSMGNLPPVVVYSPPPVTYSPPVVVNSPPIVVNSPPVVVNSPPTVLSSPPPASHAPGPSGGSTLTLTNKDAPYAYAYGESISLSFYNNKPTSNSAIACFPLTNPPTRISHTFVRTCGTPFCTTPVTQGSVMFSSSSQGIMWPLGTGNWYVVMIDADGYEQSPRCNFTVGTAPPAPPPNSLTFPSKTAPYTYTYSEAITIGYYSATAAKADILAIWPAAAWIANPRPSSRTVLGLCGKTVCTAAPPKSGSVTFASSAGGILWPLLPGEYIAVLLSAAGGGQYYIATPAYAFTVTGVAPATPYCSLTFLGKSSPTTYAYGEHITISFVNTFVSSSFSTIVILPYTNPPQTISKTFINTCGSINCTSPMPSGTVTFSPEVKGILWPLVPGVYFAVLLNGTGYVKSDKYNFTVSPGQPSPPSPPAPPACALSFVDHGTPVQYAVNQALVINFSNPVNAAKGDWVGVWTAAAWATVPAPPTKTWVRLCGTVSCTNVVKSGVVTISGSVKGIVWPLAVGAYVIVMLDVRGYPKTPAYLFNVTTGPAAPSPAPPLGSLTFVTKVAPYNLAYNEFLILDFVVTSPAKGDWIGIWWSKAWDSSKTAAKPAAALRTCGTPDCQEYPKTGSIVFTAGMTGVSWPLPTGLYRMVLLNAKNVTLSPVYTFTVLAKPKSG